MTRITVGCSSSTIEDGPAAHVVRPRGCRDQAVHRVLQGVRSLNPNTGTELLKLLSLSLQRAAQPRKLPSVANRLRARPTSTRHSRRTWAPSQPQPSPPSPKRLRSELCSSSSSGQTWYLNGREVPEPEDDGVPDEDDPLVARRTLPLAQRGRWR